MKDKIIIEDLRLYGVIGIHKWEREQPQEIIVNIELMTDLSQAGKSDNINDSIDYSVVTEMIENLVRRSRFGLLEKLADQIINLVLENFNVESITVKLSKPKALVNAKAATVVMTRLLRGGRSKK